MNMSMNRRRERERVVEEEKQDSITIDVLFALIGYL